jgi:hypothetical protein
MAYVVTLEGGKPAQGSVFLLGKGDVPRPPSSTGSVARQTYDEGDPNGDLASRGLLDEEEIDKLDPNSLDPR